MKCFNYLLNLCALILFQLSLGVLQAFTFVLVFSCDLLCMSLVHLVCEWESWSEARSMKEERRGEARVILFASVSTRGSTLARVVKISSSKSTREALNFHPHNLQFVVITLICSSHYLTRAPALHASKWTSSVLERCSNLCAHRGIMLNARFYVQIIGGNVT